MKFKVGDCIQPDWARNRYFDINDESVYCELIIEALEALNDYLTFESTHSVETSRESLINQSFIDRNYSIVTNQKIIDAAEKKYKIYKLMEIVEK